MIRIDLDTDIGMNRNSSDWIGINSYLIFGQRKNFFGLKKILFIQKNDHKSKKCYFDSKKLFSGCILN